MISKLQTNLSAAGVLPSRTEHLPTYLFVIITVPLAAASSFLAATMPDTNQKRKKVPDTMEKNTKNKNVHVMNRPRGPSKKKFRATSSKQLKEHKEITPTCNK